MDLNPKRLTPEELKFCLGLSDKEMAQATSRSVRTVRRWCKQPNTHYRPSSLLRIDRIEQVCILLLGVIGQDLENRLPMFPTSEEIIEGCHQWLRKPHDEVPFQGEAPIKWLLDRQKNEQLVQYLQGL